MTAAKVVAESARTSGIWLAMQAWSLSLCPADATSSTNVVELDKAGITARATRNGARFLVGVAARGTPADIALGNEQRDATGQRLPRAGLSGEAAALSFHPAVAPRSAHVFELHEARIAAGATRDGTGLLVEAAAGGTRADIVDGNQRRRAPSQRLPVARLSNKAAPSAFRATVAPRSAHVVELDQAGIAAIATDDRAGPLVEATAGNAPEERCTPLLRSRREHTGSVRFDMGDVAS